jgi:hypothetical protein
MSPIPEPSLEPPKPPAWMVPIPAPETPEMPQVPIEQAPVETLPAPVTTPAKPRRAPISTPLPETVHPVVEAVEARPVRVTEPGGEEVETAEDEAFEDVEAEETNEADEEVLLRIDPSFIYIILMVVTLLGTSSFAADVRYTMLWGGLALIGAAAILVNYTPVERPTMRDLVVGGSYGLLIGLPVLIVGKPQLQRASVDMFGRLGEAAVFQSLAFTMPMAETLFFRGALQWARGPLVTGLAAGLWSVVLFLPALHVIEFPLVGMVIGGSLFLLNLLYGYLADRLGLFSAWTCQIVVNVLLLGLPRLIT